MATKGKGNRKASMSAEEKAAEEALARHVKQYDGKELTDKQKEERKALQSEVGKLKFVRIANKRVAKAMKAIEGIGNLSSRQYVKTAAQSKAICDALDSQVKAVRNLFGGVKETTGFVLPGFEEKA